MELELVPAWGDSSLLALEADTAGQSAAKFCAESENFMRCHL